MFNPNTRTAKGWLYAALFCLSSAYSLQAVAAETHVVSIKKKEFRPAELTVEVGDTVKWVNDEYRQYHSVWFEEMGEPEPEYFFPDESYTKTFDKAGTFPYRCGPHPEMLGVIKVVEPGK